MICPSCGTKNSSYYCVRCGYVNKETNDYQKFNNKYPVEEIEIFIGENVDQILNKPSNYTAGVLGSLYFIYRKMYLIGLVLSLFDFMYFQLILRTNNASIQFMMIIIKWIMYASFTNPIYILFCKRKIKKIKSIDGYESKLLTYNGGSDIDSLIIGLIAWVITITAFILINISK